MRKCVFQSSTEVKQNEFTLETLFCFPKQITLYDANPGSYRDAFYMYEASALYRSAVRRFEFLEF